MPEFRIPSARDRFTASLRLGALAVAPDPSGHATADVAIDAIAWLGNIRGLAGLGASNSDLFGAHRTPDNGDGDDDRVGEILKALKQAKLRLSAFGTDDPALRDFPGGWFSSPDPEVRALALQRTMRTMDRGSALGAKLFVLELGRHPVTHPGIDDPIARDDRLRSACNFLAKYNLDRGYGLRLVLRASSRPGDQTALGDVPNARLLVASLKHADQFAISAAVSNEDTADPIPSAISDGVIARADVGNLASLDPLRAFGLVRALDRKGYSGDRHLSVRTVDHGWRSVAPDTIAQAVRGVMDRYLHLRDRIRAWESDNEIKRLHRQIDRHSPDLERLCASFSKSKAETLLAMSIDDAELRTNTMPFEALRHRTLQIIFGDG